ncbi:hypothetical protein PCHCB_000547800 [Plasmodium chabaudi chabaudi]|uniref:Uncharacterized protein n=1 Tax=Plasmodium chabaudi chabaudi TaxID=31271 RepID=A0A1D3LA34_PLACU|nr:hypothetical protein PCHCB_000547800 [Plasmodium chabaudi chabaudi]
MQVNILILVFFSIIICSFEYAENVSYTLFSFIINNIYYSFRIYLFYNSFTLSFHVFVRHLC